tara:strand:- start:222 stop:617 length:396 start_codon:yes stop_codon:yes gene_type:complete
MRKYLIIILLLSFGISQDSFRVELLNERSYPMKIDKNGTYHITVGKGQSILKMKGTTNSSLTERITWKSKNEFYWSDGMRTDIYPVVNPASYTKDGVGYSMIGLMPEMKGKTITVYGYYYDKVDSVKIIVE